MQNPSTHGLKTVLTCFGGESVTFTLVVSSRVGTDPKFEPPHTCTTLFSNSTIVVLSEHATSFTLTPPKSCTVALRIGFVDVPTPLLLTALPGASCPSALRPQHTSRFEATTAQTWPPPAASPITASPATAAGSFTAAVKLTAIVVVALSTPHSPLPFPPQQYTFPSVFSTHIVLALFTAMPTLLLAFVGNVDGWGVVPKSVVDPPRPSVSGML
jgi:hypothetical protein